MTMGLTTMQYIQVGVKFDWAILKSAWPNSTRAIMKFRLDWTCLRLAQVPDLPMNMHAYNYTTFTFRACPVKTIWKHGNLGQQRVLCLPVIYLSVKKIWAWIVLI